ncbi:MAG: SpoIIE family protein phosphatase, partial [Flavobacteriales bacterium]
GSTQQLELGCCGLGMFRDIPSIEAGTVNIRPGATLLCYTDGLVEQENSDDVPFGMQRMEEVVRERRGMPVDAVQEA